LDAAVLIAKLAKHSDFARAVNWDTAEEGGTSTEPSAR